MYEDALVALTIGLPPLAGLACYVLKNKMSRRFIVALTSLVLIVSSILLLTRGGFLYDPPAIMENVILILDLSLLIYFIYTGIHYRNLLVIGLSALQLFPIIYIEFGLQIPTVEQLIVIDGLSIIMSLIISIVGSLIVLYALNYMDEHEHHLHLEKSKQPRFFFFLLVLLGAMHGLVFSNSLYWIYFFWEVTTLCSYELIRHDGTDIAINNALTALWMNLVGGVAFVGAIYIGIEYAGSLSIEALLSISQAPVILLLFATLAFAAVTKSAQFPFNKWLQGAMVAPTPVSALLHSSTMVNAGVYLILRLAPAIQGTALSYGIALVGAFTFMITAILALNERVSKGILAYSTIGNLGLIILCAGLNTPLSYVAALTLLIFHSVSKGLLFLSAGVVENRVHTRFIEDWEGLLGKLPFTSIMMIVGMLSMFLPPFGMLLGKWIAIDAVTTSPLFTGLILIVLLLVGSTATTIYYSKWLGHLTVLPQADVKPKAEKLSPLFTLSMGVLLALSILMGTSVALVMNLLVIPALPINYFASISADLIRVSTIIGSTTIGTFITYPFWVAASGIFLIGYFIYRSKGGVIKPPYVSGENIAENPEVFMTTADSQVPIELSGMFFDNEISNTWLWNYGVMAGAVILFIMFLTVVF